MVFASFALAIASIPNSKHWTLEPLVLFRIRSVLLLDTSQLVASMPEPYPVEDKALAESVKKSLARSELFAQGWYARNPSWGTFTPMSEEKLAMYIQMAWRKKVFGDDYSKFAWKDYRTVAPASVTLQRYEKLVASNSFTPPCWERLSVVMVHQSVYRRRFWSKKTLVRLLLHLVRQVHWQLVLENNNIFPKESRQYAFPEEKGKEFFDDCMTFQENLDNVTIAPTVRTIPRATLFPKLEYIFVRMKESMEHQDVFVDLGNRHKNEMLQYWTKKVQDMEFLPSGWFSWHNEEFDEYFEYPWIDSNNLGHAQINLENDSTAT